MMLFLLSAILILMILALLLFPLLRESTINDDPGREVAIYEDQLAEIARDQDRDVLTAEQATAAQHEIERRLLVAARRQGENTLLTSRTNRLIGIVAIALVPLVAGVLYLSFGSPDKPGQPFAARSPEAVPPISVDVAGSHTNLTDRVATLEARLADNPDDAEGAALLARSYAELRRYDEALEAYQRVNEMVGGQDPRLAGEYAEVMVIANDGLVPEPARQIFTLIRQDFPNDPQATYYVALAKLQANNVIEAQQDLLALRESSPPGAPWLASVDQLLATIAAETGRPTPAAPAQTSDDRRFTGPTAEQMAAAQSMDADDRQAMIRSMVDGLAARLADNPEDVEGWRRLARAYEVLGDTAQAEAAHREVIARAPDDADARNFLDSLPGQ